MQVESLAAKVDFNERRVRHIEGSVHQARPAGGRPAERSEISVATVPAAAAAEGGTNAESPQESGQPSDGTRRRRRRRRGRRGGGTPGEGASATGGTQPASDAAGQGIDDNGEESDVIDSAPDEVVGTRATVEQRPLEEAAPPTAPPAEAASPVEPAAQPATPAEPAETIAASPAPETDRTE
jgi:ribonuclease E